jgi:hypothetical protein
MSYYNYRIEVLGDAVNLRTDSVDAVRFLLGKKSYFNIDDFSITESTLSERYTMVYRDNAQKEPKLQFLRPLGYGGRLSRA